jgi:hypothetical protein
MTYSILNLMWLSLMIHSLSLLKQKLNAGFIVFWFHILSPPNKYLLKTSYHKNVKNLHYVVINVTSTPQMCTTVTMVLLTAKHNRSLKVTVKGLDFMAHPLYIHYLQRDIKKLQRWGGA